MDRRARLEELLAEAYERQASGGLFDAEVFARSHPDFAEEIRANLRLLPLADRALGGSPGNWRAALGQPDPGAGREGARTAARRRIRGDRDAGVVHDLPYYQQQFPGYWDVVAEEYRAWSLPASSPGRSPATTPDPALRRGGSDGPPTHGLESIGSYRLLKEIGRGGMGVVYLAEDTRLRRNVALKVLSPVFSSSHDLQKRFQREAAIASKLDHPGICTVYEAGEADGTPFIAMRYIHGETLEHWIGEARVAAGLGERLALGTAGTPPQGPGPAPIVPRPALKKSTGAGTREEILRIVHLLERAGRALHVAHEASLIHRDIKPGNIMVTREGDPIVLDFGLARDEEGTGASITQTGALMGTPAYMSPEQIAAQRIRLDRRTDVYSLGVTLYEALTLRLPFTASSRDSLYQKILVSEPDNVRRLNPAVPVDLKVVIDKSLEKDRERRYPTALEFAEDLRRVRDNEPVKARPVGPITRAARWMRRNPGVAVPTLAFAGLVVVLPPAALYLYEKGRQSITGGSTIGLKELNEARRYALTPEATLALRDLQEALRLKGNADFDGAWNAAQKALNAMPDPEANSELRKFTKRLMKEIGNEQGN
jgi:serine/threonine protein kinase